MQCLTLSSIFCTDKGLREGDALACLLFNLTLGKDKLEEQLDTVRGIIRRLYKSWSFPVTLLLSASENAYDTLEIEARKLGLTTYEHKTKFSEVMSGIPRPFDFEIGDSI